MFHVGARIHAFIHGFFNLGDKAETMKLHASVVSLARLNSVDTAQGVTELAVQIQQTATARFDLDERESRSALRLVEALIEYEHLFLVPDIDWHEQRSIAEYWELKEVLGIHKDWLTDYDSICELITRTVGQVMATLQDALPQNPEWDDRSDGITVPSNIINMIADFNRVVETVMYVPMSDDAAELKMFERIRRRLEANIILASGGNPDDPDGFRRAPRLPSKSDIRNRQELVSSYLGGTPLCDVFSDTVPFTIPENSRYEHHHIVAGSGHGKTQTLQYLIANDLEAVGNGDRSIIVIDSQGDLISNIAELKCFAPGEPLHERICLIDPSDIEYPVSLNMFDVGQDRLSGYAPLERERLTNSILELYDFVLGSLLSAGMTQKQEVIFRYVTRLMLHIPDATIHTLRELMEPNAEVKFAEHIAKLKGSAAHFFDTEFKSGEFRKTKEQVLRRLWGILENQTFERMFSHPRSKLDLFAEMNAGKVILINTSKDLLKASGTEIFGRFFIALIAQAAQERAVLPKSERLSTIVYIDEAADYFDRNIETILAQARKYHVGMVLAHQYLGQLDPKLQEAFSANTAIKFAGGVSSRDARALAQMMNCEPGFIEQQTKLSFAASVRGQTTGAVPLQFEAGHLEKLPRMDHEERKALRTAMREKYSVHYTVLGANSPQDKPDSEPEDGNGHDENGSDDGSPDITPSPKW